MGPDASVEELLREYATQVQQAEHEEDVERLVELRWALASRDGIVGVAPYMGQVIEGPALRKPQLVEQSVPATQKALIGVQCPQGHPQVMVAHPGEFQFRSCDACGSDYVAACHMEVVSVRAEKKRGIWHTEIQVEDADSHTHDLLCTVPDTVELPRVGEHLTILAFGNNAYAISFKGTVTRVGSTIETDPPEETGSRDPRYHGLGRVLVSGVMGLMAALVWSFPLLQLSQETGQAKVWSIIAIVVGSCMLVGGLLSVLTPGRRMRGALNCLIAAGTVYGTLAAGSGWPITVGLSAWLTVAVLATPARRLIRRVISEVASWYLRRHQA